MTQPWPVLRAGALFLFATWQGCVVDGNIGSWSSPPRSPAAQVGRSDSDAAQPTPGDSGAVLRDAAGPSPGLTSTAAASTRAGSGGEPGPASSPSHATAQATACQLAQPGAASPLEVTVIDTDKLTYNFANDAVFQAGRYQVAYSDGCRRFDDTGAWTVHASILGSDLASIGRGGCYMIVSRGESIAIAPGSAGVVAGMGDEPLGAFETYDACVAANRLRPAVDIELAAAGTIGVLNGGDSNPAKTPGEALGGRSPTYRLTRIDPCQ